MQEKKLSDEELVQRCLRSDRKAWETLVRRHGKLVYGLALKTGLTPEDCSDVFQSVFLLAYRNLHLLDRPESLSFWLSTITRREAWEAKRKLGRMALVEATSVQSEANPEFASLSPLADQEVERTERAFLVQRALELVDERCRRLLHLLFFEEPELSYEEAARTIGMPLGSVGPTRARCLEKLRGVLERLGF